MTIEETTVSRLIIDSYYAKITGALDSDVLVAGAGPAGLMAATRLAGQGFRVVILEKRLAPGGGVWGGGMCMNEAVIQEPAIPIIREFGVRCVRRADGLYTVDTVELAAMLTVKASQAGATILNLITIEDVSVRDGRCTGLVANRTMISGAVHVDPIMFSSRAVIDGSGHDAIVVAALRKLGLMGPPGEQKRQGPMDVEAGEAFVASRVAQVFPGVWVAGMSVSAALGGPRMGPIFGGMLLSGQRAAELIAAELRKKT
jgi:thiamine thiazole synthase